MKIKNFCTVVFLFGLAISYCQTLNDYLNEAEKNSPELQSKHYLYESAVEMIDEVGSLPNTNFSAGYFIEGAETRVGEQKFKLSAIQNLPWFGTLVAKKESASFKAESRKNDIDIYKRHLFLEVKMAYYSLYELKAKENILNDHLKILNTYEKLAINELGNNRSTMVDVLKIKMERNDLFNDLNVISAEINAHKITFNILLNKKFNAPVHIPDTIISMIELPFNRESIQLNPKLLQYDNILNSINKLEEVAKKEGLPTIGIGLDYISVEERVAPLLADNGKDIIMPMVSVSVPIFSKKYSSRRKQLQLEQKAIGLTKQNEMNSLYAVYEKALADFNNSRITIETQIENIIQADQAQKVLLTAYQTAKMDFKQILEVQQLKLKFQLKKIIAEKEQAIQLAKIHFLTKY